jgi:adenylate cyclase
MMNSPCVEYQHDGAPAQTRPLVDRLYIGRLCAGVPDNQRIVIQDSNVSRDHAVITLHLSGVTIRDTSRNGTRVNGNRITSGMDHWLHSNDRITIGQCEILVRFCAPLTEHSNLAAGSDATHILTVQQTITHLVADVRGFSSLTQEFESSEIYRLISNLYDVLTDVVVRYHGVIKDYAGDAVFAFWEHAAGENTQAAINACRAALEQQRDVRQRLNQAALPKRLENGVRVGWGIATGEVTVSHYGIRHDNVAIVGDSTNLAFRLAAMANKELPSILTCQRTAMGVSGELPVQDLGKVSTKGREGLEPVYALYEETSNN